MAGNTLFNHARDGARCLPLLAELRLGFLHEDASDDGSYGENEEGHQCERPRHSQHHGGDTDDGKHRSEQLGHGLLQGLRDVVDVVGDTRKNVTATVAVQVRKWKPVDFVLNLLA